MPSKKTPTSLLSATVLLARRAWYRALARIRRMRSGGTPPGTLTTHSSPAARLPQEIVEMIIVNLTYDIRSLRACTLTCYSWYIAAVPHLHQTLFTSIDPWKYKYQWPNPIQHMYTLGLLPFVKFCWMRAGLCKTVVHSPRQFTPRILHQFLALTNVQELGIEYLDIPSFMPEIRRYFGHFLPTVRSLALREPKGSRRQIIYFIGLFQHLEDLRLLQCWAGTQYEPVDDLTLIPPSAPPLRGCLLISNFTRVDLLKDMIDLLGGIRFRGMDFFDVDDMQLLLGGCAKTLETFQLHLTDPRAESSLWDFDLSHNKSLQTLEVSARSVEVTLSGGSLDAASMLLQYALSTIQSPVFFQVVVFYCDRDLCGPQPVRFSYWVPSASQYHGQFEVFREARKVRDFRLVLCANVPDPVRERSVRVLKRAVAAEKAKNGFDDFFPAPSVTYRPYRDRW